MAKYLLTLTTGDKAQTQEYHTKATAKAAMITAMSNWRQRGRLPFNGVYVIRQGTFAGPHTATWNDDYTIATFKYSGGIYGRSRMEVASLALTQIPA